MLTASTIYNDKEGKVGCNWFRNNFRVIGL